MILRNGASNATLVGELIGVNHMPCLAHARHLVVNGALQKKKTKTIKKPGNTVAPQRQSDIFVGPSDDEDEERVEEDEFLDAVPLEDNPELETDDQRAVVALLCYISLIEVLDFVNGSTKDYEQESLQQMRANVQEFRRLASYFRRSSKGSDLLLRLQHDYCRNENDRDFLYRAGLPD
ncbi:hypothetical protein L914_00402 [Phytophthora nicotianae]|uniref:Uncharacterized protein n=2 Tax=Phytophthora nicotianae TaxID=4792 RepID=V9EJI3_PHYNI|nr:hypothetical protein F443_15016 [Phytophthora nicotianae P1569]ETM56667.1 hypothetical protein L914_00402 [Phytophthora nicotianae]